MIINAFSARGKSHVILFIILGQFKVFSPNQFLIVEETNVNFNHFFFFIWSFKDSLELLYVVRWYKVMDKNLIYFVEHSLCDRKTLVIWVFDTLGKMALCALLLDLIVSLNKCIFVGLMVCCVYNRSKVAEFSRGLLIFITCLGAFTLKLLLICLI